MLLTEILRNRRRKVSTNTYFVGAKTPTYTNWNNGKIIPLLFPLASFSYTQRRHSLPSCSFQIALVCCTLLRKGKQSRILKAKPLTQAIWNTMLITLTCVVNHFYETEKEQNLFLTATYSLTDISKFCLNSLWTLLWLICLKRVSTTTIWECLKKRSRAHRQAFVCQQRQQYGWGADTVSDHGWSIQGSSEKTEEAFLRRVNPISTKMKGLPSICHKSSLQSAVHNPSCLSELCINTAVPAVLFKTKHGGSLR